MGLLGKYLGSTTEKAPADDVLLLHAIFCVAGADGEIQDREDQTVAAYSNTLPEFRNMGVAEFERCVEQSVKISEKYNRDLKASLAVLAEIKSEAVRKKAFVLAVDIAMSSGDVTESEEQMIEAIQRILGIDDALASKITEVIALKYLT